MILVGQYVENIVTTGYICSSYSPDETYFSTCRRILSLRAHLVGISLGELRGIRNSFCSLCRKLQPQQQPHQPHTMTRSNPGGSFHQCLQRKIRRNPIQQLPYLFCPKSLSPTPHTPYHQRTILLFLQRSYQDPYLCIRLDPSIRRLKSIHQSSPDFIDPKTVFQRQTLQFIHQDARQDSLRSRDTHPPDHRNTQPHHRRLHDERLWH
jgi:hypothetical protein